MPRYCLAVCLLFLSACATAPDTYRTVALSADPDVYHSPAAALERNGLAGASVGYLLTDASSGDVITSARPDDMFLPASTVKLMTAIAALEILGPDHRFETGLCRADGALYLTGGGDPDLEPGDLMQLAGRLAETWRGQPPEAFFLDDGLYPRLGRVNADQPETAPYNPVVSSLAIRGAAVPIHWRPVSGQPGRAALFPSADLGGKAGDIPTDWLLARPDDEAGRGRFPLHDPAYFTGNMFRLFAKRQGMDPGEAQRAGAPETCAVIAVHRSRPLIELIDDMLATSNNLQAELIGLAALHRLGKDAGTLRQAAVEFQAWWRARDRKTDWTGMTIGNFSGLDPSSRISPRQMTAVLAAAGKRTGSGQSLFGRLGVSGWKGGLARRMEEPAMALRVWGKTGTMDYGVALSGLLFPRSERPLLFTLFIHAPELRTAAETGTVDILPASQWNRRARAAIDGLLRGWVASY